MKYTIKNLTNGRVTLPPPVGRSLGGGQAVVVDAPAGLMEQVDASIRGSNKFQRMKNAGIISIQSENQITASTSLEVPTSNLISGGGSVSIGGTVTGATAGSVFFAGPLGVLAQNNTNFFWNNVSVRLGLGTPSPQSTLDAGNITIGSTYRGVTAAPTNGLLVEGNVAIGTTSVPAGATLVINGSIFPSTNDAVDLGDNTHRWRDLYLGPVSVHLGTSTSNELVITESGINYASASAKTFNIQNSGAGAMTLQVDGSQVVTTTYGNTNYVMLNGGNEPISLGASPLFGFANLNNNASGEANIYVQNYSASVPTLAILVTGRETGGLSTGIFANFPEAKAVQLYSSNGSGLYLGGTDPVRTVIGTNDLPVFTAETTGDARIEAKLGVGMTFTSSSQPATTLDVKGDIAIRAVSPTAFTGTQNNYSAIGSFSFARLDGSSTPVITGIAANAQDGKRLVIANVGATAIQFNNQAAGSTATNRIITGTGADFSLVADATMELIYDATASRWRKLP